MPQTFQKLISNIEEIYMKQDNSMTSHRRVNSV